MFSRFAILFSCGLVILTGCRDTEKSRLTRLVTEWQGKEIRFPTNPVFTTLAIDTVDYLIPLSEHKILVYIDSLGCTGCKLQLERWKLFIHEMDSMTNGIVPFLFFIHAKNYQEMRYLLKRDGFNYPVCIDTGEQPLVIIDAATTCGCASPAFEKHPANPGEKLNITVRMQPKESGFFNETISVKCNTDKQIKLTIRGQAT